MRDFSCFCKILSDFTRAILKPPRIQKLTLKIKLMKLVANLISMYAIIVTRNGQEKTVVEDKLEEERVKTKGSIQALSCSTQ